MTSIDVCHSLHPVVECGGLVDHFSGGIVITFPPRPGRDDAPEPAVFGDGTDTEVIAAALRHLDIPIHAGAGPFRDRFVIRLVDGTTLTGILAMVDANQWCADTMARPVAGDRGIVWTSAKPTVHPPTITQHVWCVIRHGRAAPHRVAVADAPRYAVRSNKGGELWHARCGEHMGSVAPVPGTRGVWRGYPLNGEVTMMMTSRRGAVDAVLISHLSGCPVA